VPVVSFSDISRLFQEKGSDRISTDGSGHAADHLGAEGQNTPPQPSGLDKIIDNTKRRLEERVADEAFKAAQKIPLIGNKIVGEQMRKPYAGGLRTERIGFVLTSDLWRQKNQALALHAGPNAVDWSLALRAADEEMKAGHARYAQARTLGTHGGGDSQTWFDFPKVSFQFQAGNTIPIQTFQNEVKLPFGLEDFYNFFDLLNQPPILPTGGEDGSKEGAHNYVWVFYTSLQFPQVVLKGYFEPEGVSWNDDADSPTTLNWTASFIVHEMSPNLWDTSELVGAYKEFMRESVTFF
jgi:hypothetical protein